MKAYKLVAIPEWNSNEKFEKLFVNRPTDEDVHKVMLEWWEVREMDEWEINCNPPCWVPKVYLHHEGKTYYNYLNQWEIEEVEMIEN